MGPALAFFFRQLAAIGVFLPVGGIRAPVVGRLAAQAAPVRLLPPLADRLLRAMPTAAGDDFLLFIQLPLLLQKLRGIARLGVAVGGPLKAMLLPGFRPPGHGTAQRIILHGLVIFLHFHPGCGLHLGGAAHPIVGGGGVLLGYPVPFGQFRHGGWIELGTVLRDDDLRLRLGLSPAARGGAVVGVLRDGFLLPGGQHLHGAGAFRIPHGRAGAVSVHPLPVVGVGPVADQRPGRGLFVLLVDILLLGPSAALVH